MVCTTPDVSVLIEKAAVPPATVTGPAIWVLPSKKLTVPPSRVGESVAVKVTLVPGSVAVLGLSEGTGGG